MALSKTPGRQAKDPRDRELERLRAENDKPTRKLGTAERVIEVQGKLSALLEDLAAEGAQTDQDASTKNGRSS